jgi:hypothetical protein
MAKKRAVRNPVGRNGYVLPQEKLEQREKAFAVYRDMGKLRSYPKLLKELKANYPDVAPSQQGTIENWSRQHDWPARCQAHDDAIARGQAQGMQASSVRLATDFDQIGALLQAANQALTRAMSATPLVTRPSGCMP